MKRVLVSGATGFIGSWSLPLLVERGYDVHAVSSRPAPPSPAGVVWHRADLLDRAQTADVVERVRPTHLLHFAWYAEHGRFWTSPLNVDWVQATLALVQAFHRCGGQRLVLAGSCAEYAETDRPCSEALTPLRPATLYGTCKHATQAITTAFAAQTGLSAAWGRIFLTYGPGEHPGRLVASVVGALLRGEDALCSHGSQLRDFLYVEDLAAAFVALLDSDVRGPVNVGAGIATPVRDVAETIGRMFGTPQRIRIGALAAPSHDLPCLVADVTRLQSEIGWYPAYSLEAGLARTIDWWRHTSAREAVRHS